MVKRLLAAAAILVVAAVALYRLGGVRIALDGTGMWPRFVSRAPDYDALDADRARQRADAGAPTTAAAPSLGAPSGASSATPSPAAPLPVASPPADAVSTAVQSRRVPWPDFRGARRDGKFEGAAIRTLWPATGLPLVWKHPIGGGYASFVIAEGRAFTIEQRRDQEVVAAYDLESGRELWTNQWPGEFMEAMGGDGPRATPTYHGGRVYALGALGELRCLDATTGQVVWRRNILADNNADNLSWGMAGSPLIVDDKVVVLPGGRSARSVVAYQKDTGTPVWSSLDDQQAYSSPMLETIAGVRQIVLLSAIRAVGLTVDGGRVLWEYPFATDMGINVAQPLMLGDDRVFLSAGYGKGAAVFKVSRDGEGFSAATIWENLRMKNKFTSSVFHGGAIYGLDEAILACVDASSGELRWKGGRYGYGQLLLAGDHLIVLAENGDVVLVRASPLQHEELARFSAIEGKTWNHPVIAEGRLLVRNLREMAAFDLTPR